MQPSNCTFQKPPLLLTFARCGFEHGQRSESEVCLHPVCLSDRMLYQSLLGQQAKTLIFTLYTDSFPITITALKSKYVDSYRASNVILANSTHSRCFLYTSTFVVHSLMVFTFYFHQMTDFWIHSTTNLLRIELQTRLHAALMSDLNLQIISMNPCRRRAEARSYCVISIIICLKRSSVHIIKISFLSLCSLYTTASLTLCAKWLTFL